MSGQAKRVIEVFLDESARPTPRRTLAGAIAFEHSRRSLAEEIEVLYNGILEDSYYLDDLRTFEKFRKNGFHATDDAPDISSQFVRTIARIAGAKLFIEFSDHTRREDLTLEQTVALLEVRLAETILRKYSWADEVRFVFEQHSKLNKHYNSIVETAKRRAHFHGEVVATNSTKQQSPVLAIVDYGLVLFLRADSPEAEDWNERNWRAIRPLISSIRSLDAGGVHLRRGLVTE